LEVARSPELKIKSALCSLKLRASVLNTELAKQRDLLDFWAKRNSEAKDELSKKESKSFCDLANVQVAFMHDELMFIKRVLKELEE